MKKNIFLSKVGILLMLLFGSVSIASADEKNPTLKADPVSIAPGEVVQVDIQYDSEIQYSGFQLRVVLPEGLSFEGTEVVDEDGEKSVVYGTLGNSCLASHFADIAINKEEGSAKFGTLFYKVFHAKVKMLKNGILCSFKVKADEKLAEESQIKIADTKFAALDSNKNEYHSSYMTATIDVKKKIATGINGVEAESQDAEVVYSIGGVRLNKAAKGVNIVVRNGKAIKVVK